MTVFIKINISHATSHAMNNNILGSLGVPGAIEDSERTAAFIEKHTGDIDEIYVSLDTHHVRERQQWVACFCCSAAYSYNI